MSSNYVDLTGENGSSDDDSSVYYSPERKREKKTPGLRNAPSLPSNSGGGVVSLGSREVSNHAVFFAASSEQRKTPSIYSFYGAGVSSLGSATNVTNSNKAIPLHSNGVDSSSVSAAAASRHSNDSGDDDDDDDEDEDEDDTPSPLRLFSRAMAAVRSVVNSLVRSRRVARVHQDTGRTQPCAVGGCDCNHPHSSHTQWRNASLTTTTDVSALPNIHIHPCDPFFELKTYAATMMRREEGSNTIHGRSLVEALISVIAQAKSTTPHIIVAILKCSTARLGFSIGGFGTCNHGATVRAIPSHHSSVALNRVIPSNGIIYPTGLSFLGLNARTKCITKPHADPKLNGIHCEDWTPEEAEYAVSVLKWFILVMCQMQIPLLFIDLGGAGCARIINELKNTIMLICQAAADENQHFFRRVRVIEGGTHFSNWVTWRYQYETPMKQIVRVSRSVMATDHALKAWFELVVIPNCNALGLPVPSLPELFRELVENDWCVFVQDIASPNAMANEPAWDAAVRQVHGRFSSMRQIARRDAGPLNLTTQAHRQIVSDTQQRLVANMAHNFQSEGFFVNPTLDFQEFDDRLQAYADFKDGIYDAQPKKGAKYTFDFGECNLHQWKQNQLNRSETRVHPGWIPRIAALRAVLALKPRNPGGPQGSNLRAKPRPIWKASTYAHITSHIRNGYRED